MSDISTYYGGSILALRGSNSALIIADNRLGMSSITTSMSFNRLHQITKTCFIGTSMFVSDGQILAKEMKREANLFELVNNRPMDAKEVSSVTSHYLYSYRFQPRYIEPIVAGISKDGPFVSSMDILGCACESPFIAAGTAEKNLVGLAEVLYSSNLSDEDLFIVGMQIFLNALDRDALSGWGATSYLISEDKIVKRQVKARMD